MVSREWDRQDQEVSAKGHGASLFWNVLELDDGAVNCMLAKRCAVVHGSPCISLRGNSDFETNM